MIRRISPSSATAAPRKAAHARIALSEAADHGQPSVGWPSHRAAARAADTPSPPKTTAEAFWPEQLERREPRRRVLQTALAGYPDLGISFRCAIRDRSASGARLRLPEGLVVPPEFWLIDVAAGTAYRATAVWRHYPDVGVTLSDPLDLQAPALELQQRQLRALWIEAAPRR